MTATNYDTSGTRPILVADPISWPPPTPPTPAAGIDALRERAEELMRAHPAASIGIGVMLGLVLARVLR